MHEMVENSFTEEFLEEQVINYRPMSALGLAAFLFLLIGCLAPFLPILLGFDFLAIALAILAIFNIRRKELSGRKLAVFTLVVSIFFTGMVPAMGLIGRRAIKAKAIEHANSWFETVKEGRFHDAHQLSMFYSERRASHVSYEDFYVKPERDWTIDLDDMQQVERMEGPGPYEALALFFQEEPCRSLKEDHEKFKYTCKGITDVRRMTAGTSRIDIAYDIEFPGKKIEAVVTMQRDLMSESGGQTHWQFQSIDLAE